MDLPWPNRHEAASALACAAAAAAFTTGTGTGTGTLLAAPLVGLAVVPYRRHPHIAALAVAGVIVFYGSVLGLPAENPALLPPLLLAAYALGRYAGAPAGLGPLAVLLVASVANAPTPPTIVFVSLLLGGAWTFGRLVERRTSAARRAATMRSELEAVDPAAAAAQLVATERARLAGDVLGIVRTAVVAMQSRAAEAEQTLDAGALAAIRDDGRGAIAELRRLLGLLRSEDAEARPPAPVDPSWPGRTWRFEVAIVAGLLALALIEVTISPDAVVRWGTVLSAALIATVAVRRVDPAVACALAAIVPAIAAALGIAVPYGIWSGVAMALLAWSAAARGRPRDHGALGLFALLLLVDVRSHAPGNEAMTLMILGLAAVAGRSWSQREREERADSAAAADVRRALDSVADRALRAERLRVARELHDVVSHAVGVMVLQAGAAEAQRLRDEQRAREAVRTVSSVGASALRELDALFGLLDDGAVGAAGLAGSAREADLARALDELSGRVHAAGIRLDLHVAAGLPDRPDLLATAYRVVQEAVTNATRHARGARVEVRIRQHGVILEVVVRDDGRGDVVAPPSGGGFGLVGLAERVRAEGGEFSAGPRAGGGFVVTARLPIERVEAVPPIAPAAAPSA